MEEIASALHAAYFVASEGTGEPLKLVHRDIKPANIRITPRGEVKILDFGVAKFIADESQSGLTGTGMIVGTPNYMSPEQARAKPLDNRSDLYALGIMLYEMLTGVPPFNSARSGYVTQ